MKALLCVFTIAVITGFASGATLRVDCTGGAEYATIQEAVTAAADGDTLLVAACVYEEYVVVDSKNLTLVGSGATGTELRWSGTQPTLVFANHPLSEHGKSYLTDLAVRHTGGRHSIDCEYGTIVLEHCVTEGWVYVGGYTSNGIVDGDVEAHDCRLGAVSVSGFAIHPSIFQDCAIDMLRSSGGSDPSGVGCDALVHSSNNRIDYFSVTGGTVRSVGDSIGRVITWETYHVMSDFASEDSRIGYLFGDGGGAVSITGCSVDSVFFDGDLRADFEMTGSLVLGNAVLHNGGPYNEAGISVVQSTFGGRLELTGSLDGSNVELTSSVVAGQLSGSGGSNTLIRNNCLGVAPSFSGGVLVDNVVGDPLFCDVAGGDYSVQECSPCVGGALGGGVSGAFGIGCPCSSPVEAMSWGSLKALFRQPSN